MSPITTEPRPASETTRARIIAFTLLLLGIVVVVVMVVSVQRKLEPWVTVGTKVAEAAPARIAIGVFAMRTTDDKLAVAAIGRGTKARCLDIRFEVNNRRGAAEESGGARCRAGVIAGRGVRVEPNRTVRVFAGGTFLVAVKAVDTRDCGARSNVCAMAFDRNGTRLPLSMRKRRAGEGDRDDLLRTTLQMGGSGERYATPGQPVAEVAVEQFGAITAQVWPMSLAVDMTGATTASGGKKSSTSSKSSATGAGKKTSTTGTKTSATGGSRSTSTGGKTSTAGAGKKPAAARAQPTTAEAIGALFTRAPDGFAVRVVDDGAKRAQRATSAD